MNIFFDFDGPIIDVRDRYYRAYLESLNNISINKERILSKEDFWSLKQNRVSDFEIGILSGLGISESKDAADIRKDLSFKHDYLLLDKVFDDVFNTLKYLSSKKIDFFVVTLRREKQIKDAIKQLKLNTYLPLEKFFFVPDDRKIHNDIQEKFLLVVNAINRQRLDPKDVWIIGDADTDIHAGRLAKCGKIIAIPRGIRSRDQLAILKPDHIIENLNEISSLIEAKAFTSA